MIPRIRIGLIGDYDPAFRPHQATEEALQQVARRVEIAIDTVWLPTETLDPLPFATIAGFDALWCTPGSPFRSMNGALNGIHYAREHGVPLLGTCAGFQHIVIEYARNVLGIADAQHAEYEPQDGTLFITPLVCAIAGTTMQVMIEPGSLVGRAYGRTQAQEHYYCSFGLNPEYHTRLQDYGLLISGEDQDGEARVIELAGHPFFVGTLFVPQTNSTPDDPHPLIVAYVKAAMRFGQERAATTAD